MFGWLEALIIISATVCFIIVITILCLIIRRGSNKVAVTQQSARELPPPLTLPKTTPLRPVYEPKRRSSYGHILPRGGSSTKTMPVFDWADHPTLITDAVENGWSRFAFTTYHPSSSVRSSSMFSSLRVMNSSQQYNLVEESWEVGSESVDFMQKLHFKSDGPEPNKSIIRMGLPLPGPPVAHSFPQEAYFEISVVRCDEVNHKGMLMSKRSDNDKAKLLSQQSDSSFLARKILKEPVYAGREGGGEAVKMTVGLTVGGLSTANKVPGSYPGSIGFHSDGSVFLAGMKLVFESDQQDWAQPGKVIGCGFDPKLKKVLFTVDSELVHVIHCKSDDFAMPLYPVLAASIDTTVLVNLGQSRFSYAPANANRTQNPCFTGPVPRSSPTALGYEDSKELFSMGRLLDSEWLSRRSATVGSSTSAHNLSNQQHDSYYSNNNRTSEFDDEVSEAELFEIVLDSTGRN